jgi:hypothetical protein
MLPDGTILYNDNAAAGWNHYGPQPGDAARPVVAMADWYDAGDGASFARSGDVEWLLLAKKS